MPVKMVFTLFSLLYAFFGDNVHLTTGWLGGSLRLE